MVIRLVALSDLLRLDFSQELPVHSHSDTVRGWLALLLKDVGQMVEQ